MSDNPELTEHLKLIDELELHNRENPVLALQILGKRLELDFKALDEENKEYIKSALDAQPALKDRLNQYSKGINLGDLIVENINKPAMQISATLSV